MGRLRRSTALLSASRRRHEVVEVVAEAETDEQAREAVGELLEIDEESAGEVIEMPVKAFTQDRIKAREDETQQLEERLAALPNEGS